MSRERRNRRIAEMVGSNPKLSKCIELIAGKENRQIGTHKELATYIGDLRRRKVFVDMGPLPNGHRKISLRFENLGNGIEIGFDEASF